jgi:hypothetical protein
MKTVVCVQRPPSDDERLSLLALSEKLLADLTAGWKSEAHCHGDDSWMPNSSNHRASSPIMEEFIKRHCNVCPVINECLDYGLRETYGVWGGLLPRQRRKLLYREGRLQP